MQPLPAAHAYALQLRVGRQNSLLSPLLARLHALLAQLPHARVVATLRSFAQPASEARVLVYLPGYSSRNARNVLVGWAETTIDALNHAQPCRAPELLGRVPARDSGAHQTLVRCQPAHAALWLENHADPRTAAALLALNDHLPPLLTADPALLKTALPTAMTAALETHYPQPAAGLSPLVFANTLSGGLVAQMLAQCAALERDGLLVRSANLPAAALPTFHHVVRALGHALAASGEGSSRFDVLRLLLNQLGFDGAESDYLILLALPPQALRALQRHWRHQDAL
ncbi:hypothetical protein F2P45_23040 [Massilia sp. CCM 8733]|uniref:Uncharacterized protein n=1 Tax=Massilia mucilaginosa TaxID=2609282 RepID=A0ABX0NYL0_9BURK|nr:hypothetical protein [Massilia mucilaginosa]NHZ91858.1 hypothetical protein [Massilia mucilaginosa]